jgi:hypothetical protein
MTIKLFSGPGMELVIGDCPKCGHNGVIVEHAEIAPNGGTAHAKCAKCDFRWGVAKGGTVQSGNIYLHKAHGVRIPPTEGVSIPPYYSVTTKHRPPIKGDRPGSQRARLKFYALSTIAMTVILVLAFLAGGVMVRTACYARADGFVPLMCLLP